MQRAPDIQIDPDWQEVELPFQIGSGRTIYAGLEDNDRLRFRAFRKKSDGTLIGRAWFGTGADGPPGHVHGGAAAYILDEAMGAVGWMNDYPMLAAKLEFEYLRMAPLFTDFHVVARILGVDKKRIKVEARLNMPDGATCVLGKGSFAVLNRSQVKFIEDHGLDPRGFLRKPGLKWALDDEG